MTLKKKKLIKASRIYLQLSFIESQTVGLRKQDITVNLKKIFSKRLLTERLKR